MMVVMMMVVMMVMMMMADRAEDCRCGRGAIEEQPGINFGRPVSSSSSSSSSSGSGGRSSSFEDDVVSGSIMRIFFEIG